MTVLEIYIILPLLLPSPPVSSVHPLAGFLGRPRRWSYYIIVLLSPRAKPAEMRRNILPRLRFLLADIM